MKRLNGQLSVNDCKELSQYVDIKQFLELRKKVPVLDVRSPAEYARGHIPGVHSLPLFTEEERAEVGTKYSRMGRDEAVQAGLRLVGPKLAGFVSRARELAKGREVLLHCWRGGMRSSSMAWLLETAGFTVYLLEGGYKRYRQAFHELLGENPWTFRVIGGKTGSGKTLILKALERQGKQIIDLEELACHKGSAFGSLGQPPQPSTEQFQNDLFDVLLELDPARPVWLEDESLNIGKVILPEDFWKLMRTAPLFVIEVPEKDRLDLLVKEYGAFSREDLAASLRKIERKLGGQVLKEALKALEAGNLRDVARLALRYYDKAYAFGLKHKDTDRIFRLTFSELNPERNSRELRTFAGRKLTAVHE